MPRKKKDRNVTYFINVDLDLYISKGMDELVEALKPAYEISRGGIRASLELHRQSDSPENGIKAFVALVRKLSPRTRAIWNRAKAKTMSIGIQAVAGSRSMDFTLSSDVLSLIDSIGADVAFTVYGATEEG
jgi:hypothetical protein